MHIPSAAERRHIRSPPAQTEAGIEDFAPNLKESSQLSRAEVIGSIPDGDLIVVASAVSVQAAGRELSVRS